MRLRKKLHLCSEFKYKSVQNNTAMANVTTFLKRILKTSNEINNDVNKKELVPNPEDRIMCVKVGKLKRENLSLVSR